eukprot:2917347-Rhodomonas_salina.1
MSGDDDMMMMWNPSLWRNRRHDLTRRALHDLTLWLREQLERGREGACQPRRGEDPPQPGAHPDPLSLFRDPSSLARAKSRLVLAVTAAVVCGASCTVGCGLRCDMTCSRNKLSSFCFCGSLVVGLGHGRYVCGHHDGADRRAARERALVHGDCERVGDRGGGLAVPLHARQGRRLHGRQLLPHGTPRLPQVGAPLRLHARAAGLLRPRQGRRSQVGPDRELQVQPGAHGRGGVLQAAAVGGHLDHRREHRPGRLVLHLPLNALALVSIRAREGSWTFRGAGSKGFGALLRAM